MLLVTITVQPAARSLQFMHRVRLTGMRALEFACGAKGPESRAIFLFDGKGLVAVVDLREGTAY
jgi:hypothetical protein